MPFFTFPQRAAAWLATGLIAGNAALASTPETWDDARRDMVKACTAASTLKSPKAIGQPVHFVDDIGQSALLISGRYPQKHMKNKTGRELCLYDRRSGTAHVSEADRFGR
ncbi:MAG: hypothetical protein Q4G70_00175 [Pseudomonadota bacterium]|nr:hypothetical protein [Pseudomonadota bacterium]